MSPLPRKPVRGRVAGLGYEAVLRPDEVPLVVLPGLLSDGKQLRRLLRELACAYLTVDPLGSGTSAAPVGIDAAAAYLLPRQAEGLMELLATLEIKRADLLGVSMGGMWAQHAWALAPSLFRRVVLVASAARANARLRGIVAGLRALWACGVPRVEIWRVLLPLLYRPAFLEQPSAMALLEWLGDAPRAEHETEVALHQLDALLAHDLSPTQIACLRKAGKDPAHTCHVLGAAQDVLISTAMVGQLATELSCEPVIWLPETAHAVWIEDPLQLAQALRKIGLTNPESTGQPQKSA